MRLSEYLSPDRIRIPIHAGDKAGVLRELVDLVAPGAGVPAVIMFRAVEQREALLSTGIGFGVAIPHGRAAVERPLLAAGVTARPVPFEAVDEAPVRLVFLLVTPEGGAGHHVRLLSRIARVARRERLRQRLMEANSADVFRQAILESEAE